MHCTLWYHPLPTTKTRTKMKYFNKHYNRASKIYFISIVRLCLGTTEFNENSHCGYWPLMGASNINREHSQQTCSEMDVLLLLSRYMWAILLMIIRNVITIVFMRSVRLRSMRFVAGILIPRCADSVCQSQCRQNCEITVRTGIYNNLLYNLKTKKIIDMYIIAQFDNCT